MTLPAFYVDDLIRTALREDLPYLDAATDLLLSPSQTATAVMRAKAEGILCGVDAALRVFTLLDDSFTFTVEKKDGDPLRKGDVIATVTGPVTLLLKGERTALNLIQHMSGIATATRALVDLAAGTGACIADTRKTLPGLRALQKYAVLCGGGKNHRLNLSDCAMLKDNHIDAAGGIPRAVAAVREKLGHTVKIEVETRDLHEVAQAVDAGADIIMLDNMDTDTMKQAVALVGDKAITEASGGITLQTAAAVAQTGVDILSVGALTHSVTALDISLKIQKA